MRACKRHFSFRRVWKGVAGTLKSLCMEDWMSKKRELVRLGVWNGMERKEKEKVALGCSGPGCSSRLPANQGNLAS